MSEQYQHTLDKAGKVHVHFDDDIPFEDGVVHLFNDLTDGGISLCADEALQLRDWLNARETMLMELVAQEQGEDV
jgi:hypothetical protein